MQQGHTRNDATSPPRRRALTRTCIVLALAASGAGAQATHAAETLVLQKGDFDLSLLPGLREPLVEADIEFSERSPASGGNAGWFLPARSGTVSSSLKRLVLDGRGGMELRRGDRTLVLTRFRLQQTSAGRSVSVVAGGRRHVLATFARRAGRVFFIGNQREFAADFKKGRLTSQGAALINERLGTALSPGTLAFTAHANGLLCPRGRTCRDTPGGGN